MTASAGPALRKLYRECGDRVAFLTVYVREAHPGERYPQPETFERKLQHASDYRDRDRIPWPVAVDDIEGSFHRALDEKPHSAYVMDAEGRVVFRALWANDPGPLRDALEAVAEGREPRRREVESKLRPMLGGMGVMYEVLGLAGEEARMDVRREAPPVYGFARLAAAFRPLSPVGRGVAALAVVAGGVAAVAALGIRGWRAFR